MGFIEDLYTIDIVWLWLLIFVLLLIVLFWDRIQSSIFKSQYWKTWKPQASYFVINGEMKRIVDCTLVERQEETMSNGQIVQTHDTAIIRFSDGMDSKVPLSRIKAHSWNSLFGSWDAVRIWFVEPDFDREHYTAIIEDLKKELVTLRNENLELANASLSSVERMSKSLGTIAKNVKPTVIYPSGGPKGGFPPGAMED